MFGNLHCPLGWSLPAPFYVPITWWRIHLWVSGSWQLGGEWSFWNWLLFAPLCFYLFIYLFYFVIIIFNIYLFIWLRWVSVTARRIFSCGMRDLSCGTHVRSSCLTRDGTRAPCIGSTESYHWTTREVPCSPFSRTSSVTWHLEQNPCIFHFNKYLLSPMSQWLNSGNEGSLSLVIKGFLSCLLIFPGYNGVAPNPVLIPRLAHD